MPLNSFQETPTPTPSDLNQDAEPASSNGPATDPPTDPTQEKIKSTTSAPPESIEPEPIGQQSNAPKA